MNYNPYAAPQGAPPPSPTGPQQVGAPQPWEIGEVYTQAWEIYKANWGVLTVACVVYIVLISVPGAAIGAISAASGKQEPLFSPLNLGVDLVNQVVSAFFTIGLYRMALTAARGQTPAFGTLFSGGPRLLPYLGALVLLFLAMAVGFVLLVVPMFILLCGLWAAAFFIADSDLGPIASLKASWEVTKGQRGAYFGFVLVGGLLIMGGLFACCFGALVTFPIYLVANAIVFLRITGRGGIGAGGSGYAYGGPPGGPPPGYGGPPGGAPPGYGGGYGGPPGGAPPTGGYGPPGGFPPR